MSNQPGCQTGSGLNFNSFDLGDQIRVIVDGFGTGTGFNQIGFFIAVENGLLYWGSNVDGVARLVITPIRSIRSVVKI